MLLRTRYHFKDRRGVLLIVIEPSSTDQLWLEEECEPGDVLVYDGDELQVVHSSEVVRNLEAVDEAAVRFLRDCRPN